MPWGIRKRGNQWEVYNKDTLKAKGIHGTRARAEKQKRLLEAIKHGWKPDRHK